MSITLTPKAVTQLKELMVEQSKESAALRVWVAGGGCAGLSYGMALDDGDPEAGDQVFDHEGLRIIIDPLSLQYMDGSEVDYVEDVLGGGFKIENPNATGSCGCGSSFQTDGSEGPSGGCSGCSHSH